jgi:hypothetical protein
MRFIVHGLFGNVPVGGIFQLQRTIKNAGAPDDEMPTSMPSSRAARRAVSLAFSGSI